MLHSKLDLKTWSTLPGIVAAGKSVLLRAIRADLGEEAIDLSEVAVDPEKPLIETVGATVEEGLELLSRVGLNDAFLFLRSYNQLSDGQKYRYRNRQANRIQEAVVAYG